MSDRVVFVSYDGEHPNFCRGCFVCEIDGIEYAFGGENSGNDGIYDSFWDRDYESWGWDCGSCGDWGFYEDEFPEELSEYFDEVVECFLRHVPDCDYGCEGCR